MTDAEIVEAARNAIEEIEWDQLPEVSSINSRHEMVKAKLVTSASRLGYQGVPEFVPPPDMVGPKNRRIDVGWFDGEDIVAAFEIDGGVSEHSVHKLQTLQQQTPLCIIVSKTNNVTRVNRAVEENLPADFEHIDAGLHKYDWLPGQGNKTFSD